MDYLEQRDREREEKIRAYRKAQMDRTVFVRQARGGRWVYDHRSNHFDRGVLPGSKTVTVREALALGVDAYSMGVEASWLDL